MSGYNNGYHATRSYQGKHLKLQQFPLSGCYVTGYKTKCRKILVSVYLNHFSAKSVLLNDSQSDDSVKKYSSQDL